MTPNEYCWVTGNFLPQCDCLNCEHNQECSGADLTEDKDDDDDNED